MIDVSRPLYRALLVAGLVATVFTAGCKKKPVAATPPPPPPVEQPKPQPTVTLSASPTSINKGESSTLSWSSTNATQLTIAPEVGTVNAEGSTKVTPGDSTTYTITASGPGGSANATARVVVSTPPPPVEKAPEVDYNKIFTDEVRDAYFDFNKADRRPLRRARLHGIQPGARRSPRRRREAVPRLAGHLCRPHDHRQLRQGKTVLHAKQRDLLAAKPPRPLRPRPVTHSTACFVAGARPACGRQACCAPAIRLVSAKHPTLRSFPTGVGIFDRLSSSDRLRMTVLVARATGPQRRFEHARKQPLARKRLYLYSEE